MQHEKSDRSFSKKNLDPVAIKNQSICCLPGISPQAVGRQGIRPLSVIPVPDKEMTLCQSRDGAEIPPAPQKPSQQSGAIHKMAQQFLAVFAS